MKNAIAFFSIIALVSFTFSSCQGPFTMENNGQTIELQIDSPFEIELSANPSTGYNWVVASFDNTVIQQIGEPQHKVENPEAVGSGGMVTFEFKAIAAGETKLILEYRRIWEKDEEPAKTFEMKIIVGTMGRITAE